MNRSWMTGVLVGVAAVGVSLALTAGLRAQGGPASTGRVACIDVGKVFNEYERMKSITEELKQLEERLEAERQQRRQSLDALQATVDAMDRNDPNYQRKSTELFEGTVGYRAWFEGRQEYSTREIAVATDSIYRDILGAAEEIGRAAGYDVVLYKDEYQPVLKPEELQVQMRSRKVLFCSEAADITQVVLDKLNSDFRSKPRAPQIQVP